MERSNNTMQICVRLNDEDVVCTVSKTTTCHDVIKMATVSIENASVYALYESGHGVERQLSANTKVCKLIRSWGAEGESFRLIVRPVDKMAAKRAKVSRAAKKLQQIRSLLKKHKADHERKYQSFIDINLQANNCTEKVFKKNIDTFNTPMPVTLKPVLPVSKTSAKFDLLRRYIIESSAYLSKRESELGVMPPRTCGDGAENTVCAEVKFNETYIVQSRDLDEAFISDDSESDDSVNELDVCVMHDSIDVLSSESAFEDDSDCVSISDLDRNICDDTITTSASAQQVTSGMKANSDTSPVNFKKVHVMLSSSDLDNYVMDADLESFMHTILPDTEMSDEGVSSQGSDFEA